jgi:hypothetical protein
MDGWMLSWNQGQMLYFRSVGSGVKCCCFNRGTHTLFCTSICGSWGSGDTYCISVLFPAPNSLAYRDHDLPTDAAGFEIPHRVGGFAQRAGLVDAWDDPAGFDRSHQKRQVLVRPVVDRLVLTEYYSNTLRAEEGTQCRR